MTALSLLDHFSECSFQPLFSSSILLSWSEGCKTPFASGIPKGKSPTVSDQETVVATLLDDEVRRHDVESVFEVSVVFQKFHELELHLETTTHFKTSHQHIV